MTEFVTRIRFVHDLTEEAGFDKMDGTVHLSPTRTVALAAVEDGTIHVGVALTHPNDQFCRRAGRITAEGRLCGSAQKHFYVVESYEALVELIDATPALESTFGLVARDLSAVLSKEN